MLPVIDYSTLHSPAGRAALERVCSTWGAWQLVGHPLTEAQRERLLVNMRQFFALPTAEKRKVLRTEHNEWGFYDQERTKNKLDLKEIFDVGPPDGDKLIPQWPEQPAGFRDAVNAYYDGCEQIALSILRAVATSLNTPAEQLCAHFEPEHTSFVRLNYYPEQDPHQVNDALGINPHTDAGALTVLLQDDVAGLELEHEGQWHRISPLPEALLINLGDIVQVWSNDRYKAPLHRVAASVSSARYSAPFFFNPGYRCNYHPLPSTLDADRPARYRSINWREFRAGRALGDYGDYGEEIQISHYRI